MVVCYPDFIKFLQYMLLLDIHFKVVMLHFTHFGIGCFGSQTDIDNSCQTIPRMFCHIMAIELLPIKHDESSMYYYALFADLPNLSQLNQLC